MDYVSNLIKDLESLLTASGMRAVPGRFASYLVEESAVKAELPKNEAPTALLMLWRSLLEAMVTLAQSRVSAGELMAAMKEVARQHLAKMDDSRGRYAGLVMAELPRLIDLPLLLELAKNGLTLSPLQTTQAAGLKNSPPVIAGTSQTFAKTLKRVEATATSEVSVFLSGETGSGKGLMARRLHDLSPRRHFPFVKINCAALPSTLWESELFGYVKGAFTGAINNSLGYIRAAHHGTLFLDEIGESSPEFQAKLLNVIEDKVVFPLGSTRGYPVDFRLIVASHLPLDDLIEQKGFLPALKYRLEVIPIHLPALRQRKEDLPELIDHFLEQACLLAHQTRRLRDDTRDCLMAYHWPGNVRELMNTMHRMVTLAQEFYIYPHDLPLEISGRMSTDAEPASQWVYENTFLRAAGINAKYVEGLTTLLNGVGFGQINNRMLRQALKCSDSTVKNILRQLTQAGVLTPHGQRGGRYYKVCPPPNK